MEYKYWFAVEFPVSAAKKHRILQAGYKPEEVYHLKEKEIVLFCAYFDIKQEILINAKKSSDMGEKLREMEKQGISLVVIVDRDYPEKLRHIQSPPYGLFYKGTLPKNSVAAGIVGARKCSEYGRSTALSLGKILAENHVAVISGLAAGIDCAGHSGALAGKGKTYAVLGCGPDICYPKSSREIYENILSHSGGILSEYPPGTQPLPGHFPERNRIISGLSDILAVVEAKKKSGSLITADFALEQGKEIYAVPGRICDENFEGCNQLIDQGAGILYNLEKFLKDCNLKMENCENILKCSQLGLEKEEQLLYSCLDSEPKFIDIIIEETGFSFLETLHLLNKLKKQGLVRECFKNYFCKKVY